MEAHFIAEKFFEFRADMLFGGPRPRNHVPNIFCEYLHTLLAQHGGESIRYRHLTSSTRFLGERRRGALLLHHVCHGSPDNAKKMPSSPVPENQKSALPATYKHVQVTAPQ